jgi:heme iron utilization protein
MTSNPGTSDRQHAYSGPELPHLPEPSYAERVRTLLSQTTIGMVSTCSRRHEGFPFGSLMPFVLDPDGRPVFLISNMAVHTQNLKADPRASLFVTQADGDGDPLGLARVTLLGRVTPIPEGDLPAARELYIAAHNNSRYWVDFADFGFFRLEPIDIYYVGGFGVMGWVDAREYGSASPDPLATVAEGIISHMNADHVDAMIVLARAAAGIEASEAAMTAVDRLGFHLRLRTAEGMKGTRINFPSEVRTPDAARKTLIDMVRHAREQAR